MNDRNYISRYIRGIYRELSYPSISFFFSSSQILYIDYCSEVIDRDSLSLLLIDSYSKTQNITERDSLSKNNIKKKKTLSKSIFHLLIVVTCTRCYLSQRSNKTNKSPLIIGRLSLLSLFSLQTKKVFSSRLEVKLEI